MALSEQKQSAGELLALTTWLISAGEADTCYRVTRKNLLTSVRRGVNPPERNPGDRRSGTSGGLQVCAATATAGIAVEAVRVPFRRSGRSACTSRSRP